MRTLFEFCARYDSIKALGFIKTHRAGPTGIGKTLEDLLGIVENNVGEPDFGEYELKARRENANSMLTLFTRAPQPPRANTRLLLKFGYASTAYSNDDKVLHVTLSADRFVPVATTGHQLKIVCDEEKACIADENGLENVYWTWDALRTCFNRKYKNKLVYAIAECRGVGTNEEFYFKEAYEMSGFDYDAWQSLFIQGKVLVDLSIGQFPNGRTHDHGTAFRIRECDHPLLFKIRNRIIEEEHPIDAVMINLENVHCWKTNHPWKTVERNPVF